LLRTHFDGTVIRSSLIGWGELAKPNAEPAKPNATSNVGLPASAQPTLWINHVRYADTWHLRERMLEPFVWGPGPYRK
jgi:hypothetical protein